MAAHAPRRYRPSVACRRRCRGTARLAPSTRASSASTMPGIARSPAAHAPNAPTPGSTMRSAPRTASGSAVTAMSRAPAALSALCDRMEIARAVVDQGEVIGQRRHRPGPSRLERVAAVPEWRAITYLDAAQCVRADGDDRARHARRSRPHTPSVPLVEGIASALRGSISTASRSARARPLNALSTMWWLFCP